MDTNLFHLLDEVEQPILTVTTTTSDPQVAFANRYFLEEICYDKSSVKKSFLKWEIFAEAVRKTFQSNNPSTIDIQLCQKNNTFSNWEVKMVPLYNGVASSFRRIKNDKSETAAIWKIFEKSSDLIACWAEYNKKDNDIFFLQVSERFCDCIGKPISQVHGKFFKQLNLSEHTISKFQVFDEIRLLGKLDEPMAETKYGPFIIRFTGLIEGYPRFLLYFEDKKAIHDIMESMELTPTKGIEVLEVTTEMKLTKELQQYKDQVEELVKARTAHLQTELDSKKRLLAIMSSDIRTPSAGVVSALSSLMECKLTDEQLEFVRIIESCSQQLHEVINDVLDLSKMEEANFQLQKLPVAIEKVLESSIDAVFSRAERKNLELISYVEKEVPHFLIGDELRIRKILVNLLNNAIKFTEKGEIVIKATAKLLNDSQFEIIFSVSDTGIGITSIRRYGNELNLTMCKRLAEQMGGTISFTSLEGSGTVFCFTLKTSGSSQPKQEKLYNKKILIFLRNQTLTRTLTTSFNNCGIQVTSFDSLEVANQSQSKYDFALVEMDSASTPPTPLLALFEKLEKSKCNVLTTGCRYKEISLPFLPKPLKFRIVLQKIHEGLQKTEMVHRDVKILIAEDNAVSQKLMIKMLQSLGYDDLIAVENGFEAVKAASEYDFDIILMDVMMPIMSGIEATERIRKMETHQPAIIAVTANAFAKDQCLEVGMDEVMTKPFQRSQLSNILKNYLEQKT